MLELREERVAVGELELVLLRPRSPETLLDEEAFARDEFLPYWAELWPAAAALAAALPERLDGLRVVEVGCGLGLPALVAAARGAEVTAVDWAAEAIELLRRNAAANGLALRAEVCDWREPWDERLWTKRHGKRAVAATGFAFELALASDVLYEQRNVEPLLALLPALAPHALIGLAGRPYEGEFLRRMGAVEQVAERVVRIRRPTQGGRPAPPGA